MNISVIIPVWNEQAKIADDIRRLNKFLQTEGLTGEIIVVDDGSSDHTAKVVQSMSDPLSVPLKIYSYLPHRGKGYAVRLGMKESRGEITMFMDSGGNVPLKYIRDGMELIGAGKCEIAAGSRHLPASYIRRHLIWRRRIFSFLFRSFIKRYLELPRRLTDTQCGFKIFRGGVAREIFALCQSDGFLFDVEVILLSLQRGYRLKEFAIEWTCDRDSRLSVLRTPWPLLKELKQLKKQFQMKRDSDIYPGQRSLQ